MGKQLAFMAMLLALGGTAQAERIAVPATLWEQPRSGVIIRAQAEIRDSVEQLIADPEARLLIHFGKGDEALAQAEELRAWLVSLAVDGDRIELAADEESGAGLSLELVNTILDQEKQQETKRNP